MSSAKENYCLFCDSKWTTLVSITKTINMHLCATHKRIVPPIIKQVIARTIVAVHNEKGGEHVK